MSNFKLPDELLGGAVKVIRPTDLRNRVGMYMMEERGVKMGRNVDPGDVQDMIVEFAQREIEKLATPASTARTDALLNLLRAADDVLAEQSLINQRFTQKQDALFAELMGWRDANGILAAPGSVPQTPNNHSDLFFGNLQYSLQTLFAKVGNPFKDLAEWGAVWEALESARKHFAYPKRSRRKRRNREN